MQGLGCIICPLSGTAWIDAGKSWHHFYAIGLALAVASGAALGIAFVGFAPDKLEDEAPGSSLSGYVAGHETHEKTLKLDADVSSTRKQSKSLYLRLDVWLFGILYFDFVVSCGTHSTWTSRTWLQGVEYCWSVWGINYLQTERNGTVK